MASHADPNAAPVEEKKATDFYAILGVEKTASQGEIKQAYRKAAIKCHPDKNPGNEEAAEKFKELSTAYAVLSDPNQKRQYDLHGADGEGSDRFEAQVVNVQEMGTFGRIFGAMCSKVGIPIPTEIVPRVLADAQLLCKGSQGGGSGEPLPKVTPLAWGQVVGGTCERQTAQFFRLKVSEEDVKNGVVIHCTSTGNDKFKVVMFDADGAVSVVEESQKGKKGNEARLILVPFERYNHSDAMPIHSMQKMQEDDVPPVFMVLDTFQKETRELRAGEHLMCMYGDNFFQSVKYQLRCHVAAPRDEAAALKIMQTEAELAEKREHLEKFQTEFMDLKKKFEAACMALNQDGEEVVNLMEARNAAYSDFLASSADKYTPSAPIRPEGQPASGGLLKKIFKK